MRKKLFHILISLLVFTTASAADGRFIHRNASNNMYYFSGNVGADGQMAWKQIDGAAKDIAMTADGQMICVGTDDAIYYSSGVDANGKANWKKQTGTAATHVAARGNNFMHRNSANNMYVFSGKPDVNGQMAWMQIDGAAKSIAIAGDGQMICVGTDNAIYYSSGVDANGKANWKKQNGTAATHVAIGGSNKFLHRNSANNMYYFSGNPDANGQMAWKKIDGAAKNIALMGDGQMMCVGTDDAIWYSSGVDANGKANWKKQNGTAATHVAAAGLTSSTSATSYTFNPTVEGTGKVTFNSNWKFGDKDILKFKARGKKEVVVVLSTEQSQTPAGGKIYKLAIGRGNNNYTSLLGNSDYSILLGNNVSVGMTQPDWGDYWVQLNNNILSFGTGPTPGSNTKGSWTIAADKQITPKFFGLGGWDQQIEYSNIEITKQSETPSSLSGQIWGVNANDQIYYRTGIDASNPFGTAWQ
ncbi:MAG: tectonin domain-containing protein, partial [bacterium]